MKQGQSTPSAVTTYVLAVERSHNLCKEPFVTELFAIDHQRCHATQIVEPLKKFLETLNAKPLKSRSTIP